MNDNDSQDSSTPVKKNFFSIILNHLFHDEPKNRNDLLKLIKKLKKNELIDNDTSDMLEGVMNIVKERVRDVMIPRSQIVSIQNHQSVEDCLNIIIKSAHSRFPVINKDKDHIEGILMAKDLLPFMKKNSALFNIEKILRPAIVVSEHKRVDKMLKEFRLQHHHMAIVIDEFGAMSGLITIEDILELIVGNIEDEYDDTNNKNIYQLTKKTFNICALTPIIDFNKIFHTNFKSEEIDTIGGLVMQTFGHLPKHGDSIDIEGYIFKIILTDSRRIIQMIVDIPKNLDFSLIPSKKKPTTFIKNE
ncbi:CNNM family magnesium/cobalt transport protein CorC [Blochmannia endosymbiont of Polyrhachis (Hedomyrma) turneri]|uniref:CNNM family magnesium/cobalt transport protein CorC n=1 Tax=Blochmannia endosymbiont of Polyrhachis (Hedomyrma) turneri TaxID=1505596 RepID=UPI00061A749C|nr:CNNM family magnesium/cobalt transport protein CorC [Blochmannia endosymbiont of Polyrhachis (Hedomyrma) turneri]AKC59886.1 Magnesium and cobalt efflux protein CorC [Blochmannia endosymbiont of Polyrhachis (Hedomyrma) turneri]